MRRAGLLLLALGACRPLPIPPPGIAAERPPPPAMQRDFGIERPVRTVPPIPPPR